MGRNRDTAQSLRDMELFCGRVLDCYAGLDQDTFVMTGNLYDSAMWNLVLIGEAASNVPKTFKDDHPHIPWSLIVGARNRFIHGYWRIDNDIVWNIVTIHVPRLLDELGKILQMIDRERS